MPARRSPAGLRQELRESIEERQITIIFNEEELPALGDLKKDKFSIGGHHKVEAAENQAQAREHLVAAIREMLGDIAGLDPELVVGASPVEPAALRLLRRIVIYHDGLWLSGTPYN